MLMLVNIQRLYDISYYVSDVRLFDPKVFVISSSASVSEFINNKIVPDIFQY